MQDESLSRRERQIMNVIYAAGSADVQHVVDALADPPSYTSVRTTLGLLEGKGHLKHHKEGQRYIYKPTVPREKARSAALHQVVSTFFENSAEQTVAALLDLGARDLSDEQLDRLAKMIEQARKEGR